MTMLAVLFMGTAVLFVVILVAWCYYRVLVHVDELTDTESPDPKKRDNDVATRDDAG